MRMSCLVECACEPITHVQNTVFKCFLYPSRGLLVRVLLVSDNCCFLIKVKGNKTFLVSYEPPNIIQSFNGKRPENDAKSLDADTIHRWAYLKSGRILEVAMFWGIMRPFIREGLKNRRLRVSFLLLHAENRKQKETSLSLSLPLSLFFRSLRNFHL